MELMETLELLILCKIIFSSLIGILNIFLHYYYGCLIEEDLVILGIQEMFVVE